MGWTINLNWLQPSTVGNAWGEVNWWLLHQAFLQNPPLHLRFETRGKWKSILPCKPIIFIFRGHNPYFSGVKTFIVHGNHYHPEVFEVFSKGELPCSESRWLAAPNLGGDLQGAMINKTIHRSCAIDPFRVVYDDICLSQMGWWDRWSFVVEQQHEVRKIWVVCVEDDISSITVLD